MDREEVDKKINLGDLVKYCKYFYDYSCYMSPELEERGIVIKLKKYNENIVANIILSSTQYDYYHFNNQTQAYIRWNKTGLYSWELVSNLYKII